MHTIDWLNIVEIALGVVIAVVYPVLLAYIRQQFPPAFRQRSSGWLAKYAALLVFSVVTAIIALVVYRMANPQGVLSVWAALMLGFGAESTAEKILVHHPRLPLQVSA